MLATRAPIGIVDLEDALCGVVTAMSSLILLLNDGELVENVGHRVSQNSASYKGLLHNAFLPERMRQTSAHFSFDFALLP